MLSALFALALVATGCQANQGEETVAEESVLSGEPATQVADQTSGAEAPLTADDETGDGQVATDASAADAGSDNDENGADSGQDATEAASAAVVDKGAAGDASSDAAPSVPTVGTAADDAVETDAEVAHKRGPGKKRKPTPIPKPRPTIKRRPVPTPDTRATTTTVQAAAPGVTPDPDPVVTAGPIPGPPDPTPTTPTTRPSTTTTTTAPPTNPPPGPNPPPSGAAFVEDFAAGGWQSRFDFDVYHRDDSLVRDTQWAGDHASTGPNDLCGPPTDKRTVSRGDRNGGFNDEWIYRCVPGGDLAKAHVMTTIGDTSGYSIGAFTPSATFNNVREVRWDVNQTDLGDRQWTEVAIIPAGNFDMQNLPCSTDVPCGATTHDVVGSVGTQWSGGRSRLIQTAAEPGGYQEAVGELGYRCGECPYSPSLRFGGSYGVDDPALTSIKIRRNNFFRDNENGTLTWGFQLDDGSYQELTVPGSFPDGPVRVVFKDHNYTPMKSPATLLPETTFTWHWDNIAVYTS